jgi:hypothetical protein
MNRIGAPTVSTAAPSQREKTQTQKQSKEVKVKRAEKEATGKNNGVSK